MRLRSPGRLAAAIATALALAVSTGCSGGTAGPAAVTSSGPAPVTSSPPVAVSSSSRPATSAGGSAGPSRSASGTIDFGPDAASFVTATDGWVLAPGPCGHCGIVYRTTDAGRRWQVAARPTLPGGKQALAQGLVDLYFADAQDGYIFTGYHCASDCLLATGNGGRSWHPAPLPAVARLVRGGSNLYALVARGPDQPLGLLRSADGGQRWTGVSLPVTSRALDLAAQGAALVLLRPSSAGTDPSPDQLGRLWYSADDGATWSTRPNPCTTSDGGAALISLALGHPTALLVDCFDNEQSSQAQETQHHLYGSADTGRTWVRLADPTHVGEPVLMADNVGPTHYAPEHLYRTTDAGRTWRKVPLPAP